MLTVGHPGHASFDVQDTSGTWDVSDVKITGPPGLDVKAHSDGESAEATFTPTAAGDLTFTGTWTQKPLEGPQSEGCTGSATGTLTATAPTRVTVGRGLGYDAGSGHFTILAIASASFVHGDRSPIRMAVRVIKRQHRPPASTPATTLTFNPNGPSRGSTTSGPLVRLHAYIVDDESHAVYRFETRVTVPVASGKIARRGIEIRLSQGSRKLRTIVWATKCDGAHGGVFCYPYLPNSD